MKTPGFFIGLLFIGLGILFSQASAQSLRDIGDNVGQSHKSLMNDKTGTLDRVVGLRVPISALGFNKNNLNDQSTERLTDALFGMFGDVIKLERHRIKKQEARAKNDWYVVKYQQERDGIPIFGSDFSYSIDPHGDIVSFGTTVFPEENATQSVAREDI